MSKLPEKPVHPGTFIKEHIIPAGMSVTDAAKRLGVGRPALSNMLNGNSSLSPDMAVRLEKSFGVDRQKLLDIKAAFDRYDRRKKEMRIAAHNYVPVFLNIKARQVHEWAESDINARHLLPVLLRKLIHSTGHGLRQVDFPGYDNAERRGWDGWVEADAATPWIPEGKSGWEFGTENSPKSKAERDFENRASVPSDEKAECTFVFVTPRNWPGKKDWARSKQAEGDWKAVRAFDASDLEQWLEESISGQMWLAEQLAIPEISEFETLKQSWRRWEEASEPNMTPTMFEPSIIAYRKRFREWLEKTSEKPFVLAADSTDEALAFLACLFQDFNTHSEDLATVFKSAETLRTLANSSSPFIPIVYTEEAERELAALYRRLHCIIVRPRNAIDSKPDIALDLLNHETFQKALAEMGIEGDRAEHLARESGRSPTILRRRLSQMDAIKKPQWAGDAEVAKRLIPMTLVGAWHAKSNADCEVVSTLADRRYKEIEEDIGRLRQFNDCPVWSIGEYRGVASKIDALFACKHYVTKKNFDDFFFLAEYVLSESDPKLDLPEGNRWAAELYGKVRNHSSALRDGLCETLVILSAHGNNLFQERFGINIESGVASLIGKLLRPLTLDKLLSHDNDLPHYAEAAPAEFLKLIEDDLRKPQPIVMGLLKPVESGNLFSSPSRTGLLWALECLAWKHLGRVSLILAQLSKVDINDNWINKPISSLYATYRSWLPQTAASLKERIKALGILMDKFPDIGWQICIDQFQTGSKIGHFSHRPRWRNDASGAGRSVTRREFDEFRSKALALALAWPKHDQNTLGALVKRLPDMSEERQGLVWDLIDTWTDSESDEKAKAGLRELIRDFAFTRRGRVHGLKDATKNRAHMAYEKLEPGNPVDRHAWLFAQHWIEPSTDEIDDEDFDHTKHEGKIRMSRAQAMREIWMDCGFEGLKALLSRSDAPSTIGGSLGLNITTVNAQTDFLEQCLSTAGTSDLDRKIEDCIQGFLMSVDDGGLDAILSAVCEDMNTDRIVRLFRCAPFKQTTWRLLDQYCQEIQERYWQEVVPQWSHYSEEEAIEIIDRLLEALRPRTAFQAVRLDWSQVETSRLKRLLFAVATVDAEPADWYRPQDYHLSDALDALGDRTGVSPDEMAQLEFMFISALEHSKYGIPNIGRQIATSPAFFVQVLALAVKRNDDRQDPPEWQIEDTERQAELASAANRLLGRIEHIPGTDSEGKVNAEELIDWIAEARRLCAEHGRIKLGDQKIGELLSRGPAEGDGSRPCLPVCEAMERTASKHIGTGFHIGVFNGRGVVSRGIDEGGTQERDLAAKYRGWAQQRAFDYPYVTSVLERIAADYDWEAKWEDTEVEIRKRLGHR